MLIKGMEDCAVIVWICTDMEGLSGVDSVDQCYNAGSPSHNYGCEQLTEDVNAAVAGCFDAGADEVRVMDGHGPNGNKGFRMEKLDPRVKLVFFSQYNPLRFEGLDETIDAVAMIGQHSMVGTLHGFIDHTQSSKRICRYKINGTEYGEMGQFALYSGALGIPLNYVSGDEALCEEARRQFPHAMSTPTKIGTGWATCDLYPTDEVRANIRRDIAAAMSNIDSSKAWRPRSPVDISVEWAWSELADNMAVIPGVKRIDARTVAWEIVNPLDIYTWPSKNWSPGSTVWSRCREGTGPANE